MKLNLGCGRDYKEGYINIDLDKNIKTDYYIDFEKEVFPFEDNSIIEVLIYYTLEHLNDINFLMREVWRICNSSSLIHIRFEHALHYRCIGDPLHKTRLTEETFRYWYNAQMSDFKGDVKINFEVINEILHYESPYDIMTKEEQEMSRKKYLNVVSSVYQTLRPIK